MAETVQNHKMSATATGVDKTSGTVPSKAAVTTGGGFKFKGVQPACSGVQEHAL